MDDRDIFVIEVSRRGRDGDYAGATEVAMLKTRADALEARPNITSLDAVPDVAITSLAAGQVLTSNGSGQWVNSTPSSGINVRESSQTITPNAVFIDFTGAFAVSTNSQYPDTYSIIGLNLAGSGSSGYPARSDHTHTNPAPTRAPFGPQAYMSSGTRPLGSTSVTLAAGISYVVKARLNLQMRGADAGPCYYQLRLTINGNARTSNGGTTGFWCVQGVPDKTTWEHHITMTGTGSDITISADCIYYGGGGFYTDAGEIVVEPVASR